MRRRPPIALAAIVSFLVLVAVLTTPLDLLLIRAGRLDIGRGFPIHLVMWAPGVAALVTCLAFGIDPRFLGLARLAPRWTLLGYLLVIGYAGAASLIVWGGGLAPLDWPGFVRACAGQYDGAPGASVMAILFTLTFGVVQSGASALGEEIGWRGFLVPALRSRLGTPATMVSSGLVWAVWHFPLTIFADYGGGAPLAFQLGCFTVMIVATGTIYGIVRLSSGSVWPAVVMHAAHNAVIQWLLDPMTDETGRGAWWAGEFGAALAIVTALLAIVLMLAVPARRRSEERGL